MLKEMLNETTSALKGNKANKFCKKRLMFFKKLLGKRVKIYNNMHVHVVTLEWVGFGL